MKSIKNVLLLIFLILFSLSCAFLNKSFPSIGDLGDMISGGFSSGPSGFTAKAPPYGSVKLNWESVEDAQIYVLERQLEGHDNFVPVMAFSAVQTSYEDYLAPQGSELTYRIQTAKDGRLGGFSTASVKTAAVLPNPLTVQVTFVEDQMVTQSIGPEGGSMSLTDQNGVEYELTVPAGAVLDATDFTLTPVSDVTVWPLDGPNLGSVRIGPEGLDLNGHLTLAITLPDEFPQDGTTPVGYGFDGPGTEFHLFPAGVTAAGTSTQPVTKAGSQGLGTGSKEKIIEFVVDHWVTQEAVNINQLLVVQQLVDAELPPLPADIPPSVDVFQNKDALNIQRGIWTIIDQIVSADNANNYDCESVSNWYDQSKVLLEQASEPANIDFIQSTTTQELLSLLNGAITKVVTDGISECENSEQGNPPAGRSCVQELVSKLQADSGKTFGSYAVPNGGFNTSDLEDFQNTLNNSCSNPGYRMPEGMMFGGTLSPDPICDLTQPFSFTTNMSGVDMIMTWTPPGTFQQHVSVEGCTGDFNGTYTSQVSEDGSMITLTLTMPELTVSCLDIPGMSIPLPPSPTTIVLIADPTASCP